MAYCPPQDPTGTSFNTVNENNRQLEKAKGVIVRGLPPSGVIVVSVDGFGMREFPTVELESVVRRGMALDSDPVRSLGTSLESLHSLNFRDSVCFFQIEQSQGHTLTILETTLGRLDSPVMGLEEGRFLSYARREVSSVLTKLVSSITLIELYIGQKLTERQHTCVL